MRASPAEAGRGEVPTSGPLRRALSDAFEFGFSFFPEGFNAFLGIF
jgi:hypothetical protein